MSTASTMSFASTYVLASRVRSKLTKQAADPKSSLRTLVLQANMLDNIMDHITLKTEEMKREKKVTFSTPEPIQHKHSAMEISSGPSVTEYEIDSDSDSDFDSDSDSDEELENIVYMSEEEDDDYYFSSDSDAEDDEVQHIDRLLLSRKKTMPVMNLSDDRQLSVILEENEDSLPELTHSISSSDSEFEDEMHVPNYILSAVHSNTSTDSLLGEKLTARKEESNFLQAQHHHENDGFSTMETVF